MATLYYARKAGKIYRWNKIPPEGERSVSLGDNLTIKYKRIRVVSRAFDTFGSSEVAIINNIRTFHTKESAPDNIVYYDKSANPKKMHKATDTKLDMLVPRKVLDIDTFNPGQYGNDVCYYTPSYQNNDITICTKFYEIDERFGVLSMLSKLSLLGNSVPKYGVYFSMAGKFLQGVDTILDRLTYKKELTDDHVVQFTINDIDRPMYYGSYICLPTCDYNDISSIMNSYTLDDDNLIHIKDNTIFPHSYFVVELSQSIDPTLPDFNFNRNTNDLLTKIDNRDKVGMAEFMSTNEDAYNFRLIQEIIDITSGPNVARGVDVSSIIPIYNKLSPANKKWLLDTFPHLSGLLHSE